MARDSMKNNCLLSTYYGQGTIQILAFMFPLANIHEFSSTTNHLVFFTHGWKRPVAINCF